VRRWVAEWWQYLVYERGWPIETRKASLMRQRNAFEIGREYERSQQRDAG
jgi:hypothetical protein